MNQIVEKIHAGERLTREDGRRLYKCNDLTQLGMLADSVRWEKHPEPIVTYVVDRNINFTNICVAQCNFCAFYRNVGDKKEGYVLQKEEIGKKIEELIAQGGYQVLMQGGLNPALKIEYYEDLFRWISQNYPQIWIHALSPAEILYIAKISKLDTKTTLLRLRDAGLKSIPGGGAEILVDFIRDELHAAPKSSSDGWLGLMKESHELGIRSSATMMFGSVESEDDRLTHMLRIRELQDETNGFTAFICWTYQPENTELGGEKASSFEYLKTLAISRLMIDNIDNVQASWVTQGPKIGQIALRFGANDFGGTMMEENVVSASGTTHQVSPSIAERLIKDAGFTPKRRTQDYKIFSNSSAECSHRRKATTADRLLP
ncbi:dehypoxanthine futalosine cyclase [bacterium]|nr:dehypoxanthine futalosine cyclase [bacterium]